MVKDLDDTQKRELATMLIESVKPSTKAGNNGYSLKPYTLAELHARIEQGEREIAAGLSQDSEEMFRELEEELAREEQKCS